MNSSAAYGGYESYASDGATSTTLDEYRRVPTSSMAGYSSANQYSTPTPTGDLPMKSKTKRAQSVKYKDDYDMPPSTSYDRFDEEQEDIEK